MFFFVTDWPEVREGEWLNALLVVVGRRPQGAERWVGGERGTDCVNWCSDVEEARKVRWSEVVEGPASEPWNFVLDINICIYKYIIMSYHDPHAFTFDWQRQSNGKRWAKILHGMFERNHFVGTWEPR